MTIVKEFLSKTSRVSGATISSYAAIVLSGMLGGVSMFLFVLFLYTGAPSHLDMGFSQKSVLVFDAMLCILFFLQHSLMIRQGFRKKISDLLPKEYVGAVYSTFSGVFLLILMGFWQKSTSIQVEFDGALYVVMRGLFFLGLIFFYISSRFLKQFDPFGIREILSRVNGRITKQPSLSILGAYQWIRHPLYLFCLMMIWSQVNLTTDRLLFNVLWTLWIIIGTVLEERDLVAVFGDEYRRYQKNVPMLLPYKWHPWKNKKTN